MQSVRQEAGTAHRAIRVVVADDDPAMRRSIVDYLESNGVQAAAADGRRDLARHITETNPDLVILDLQLDQENSLPLLGQIRSKSGGPAIIGIGRGRDEIDRVVGLELGADDYLAKPFGLRELLARIRAVLRGRDAVRAVPQRERAPERGRCRFGGWQLERRLRRLTDPRGDVVALSKSEYALLIAFVEAPQRPLSREQLLQATRVHEDVFDRSVDVQVLRLRRKLEADPSDPQIIRTERGVGYVFTLPVEML
ncbi:winged helix-turn-helix domain-containing protein [Inquilinus sp.]|uniref:winged helix-turn-helix domain-containing protein n=1 Tax=Inquilinus sp. TaxID=1932117 RepID=UPI0031D967B7